MKKTDRLLRREQVEDICGICCATIYSMMSQGKFPKPVKLGKKMVRWTESSIQDWIAKVSESEPGVDSDDMKAA